MKPTRKTVEQILQLGGTWRLTDLSRAAMTAVGDTRLRHRISLFLQGMMEEGRVERVSRGLYRWI